MFFINVLEELIIAKIAFEICWPLAPNFAEGPNFVEGPNFAQAPNLNKLQKLHDFWSSCKHFEGGYNLGSSDVVVHRVVDFQFPVE